LSFDERTPIEPRCDGDVGGSARDFRRETSRSSTTPGPPGPGVVRRVASSCDSVGPPTLSQPRSRIGVDEAHVPLIFFNELLTLCRRHLTEVELGSRHCGDVCLKAPEIPLPLDKSFENVGGVSLQPPRGHMVAGRRAVNAWRQDVAPAGRRAVERRPDFCGTGGGSQASNGESTQSTDRENSYGLISFVISGYRSKGLSGRAPEISPPLSITVQPGRPPSLQRFSSTDAAEASQASLRPASPLTSTVISRKKLANAAVEVSLVLSHTVGGTIDYQMRDSQSEGQDPLDRLLETVD